MDHNETGCQAPERPILCVNNCGFFGSGATRNMCSKCHKEAVLKEEQAKMAASSIEHIVNGSSNRGEEALVTTDAIDVNQGSSAETNSVDNSQVSYNSNTIQISQGKKQGPSRCTSCSKRVGLTGFTCRCGNVFCGTHRYSDKHDCPFDYRAAAQDVIAKANPVVKADKLDRI